MTIGFQSDNISMPFIDSAKLQQWIAAVAKSYWYRVGAITYIFCNDEKILQVNRQFLQHDYYTDIITFDDTIGHTIQGDIYISLDTVASNAELQQTDYQDELNRVIIHGVLHLCGINDKGPGERAIMEEAENKALTLLSQLFEL